MLTPRQEEERYSMQHPRTSLVVANAKPTVPHNLEEKTTISGTGDWWLSALLRLYFKWNEELGQCKGQVTEWILLKYCILILA
jgi:hypothetical protein